ncbi:MAG: hypothetical protein IBX55_03825 [Methyloprofundus sp.]|nr:hypothetical protein [Methyloprofundus sp.]MBW6453985.1 hypothetical protein [Methyloprofundus sp.]
MLLLLRVILYSIAIPTLTIAICISLSTSNKTISIPQWQLTNSDIQRAKNILHANQHSTDQIVSLSLSERDLNIACAYLLNLYADSQSLIKLSTDYLSFQLRFTLPDNLFGRYIDLQFQLYIPPYQAPAIKNLQIGQMTIADAYAGLFIDKAIQHTRLNQYLSLFLQNLKEIHLNPGQLQIKYQLPAQASTKIENLLTPNIDQRALNQYQKTLDKALLKHDATWRLSLSDVLQPLFQLAQQRSTATNAIEENQLVIFIANRYVNNYSDSKNKKRKAIPYYVPSLYKRTDMAQHFMWSAALSASGSSHLAHLVGVEKELNDAKRGSGFSFIDLAADRAGVKLGEYATANPEQALKIQQKMANITNYQAFMPEIRDLPENLSAQAFYAQYESIYSAKYQSVLQEIDQRISACAIYQ